MKQRKVEFVSSAFRHNFTEVDICWVLDNHLADGVVERGVIMPQLTDEEYAVLDEKWARETPKVNWSRPGAFARDRLLLESLDALSANYIYAKAQTAGQTPAQVIGALVREKVAVIADPSRTG
jgi:hypothetical protein